jgi:acyl-CoA thioester hydrolase
MIARAMNSIVAKRPPAAGAKAHACTHTFPIRVYYEDTDAGGVVYYANYLRFAERARTEFMRDAGADHAGMLRDTGLSFFVRRCEADYLKPARLDDLLHVETRITHVGGASLEALQTVKRNGEDLCRLKVKLACLNRAGRPARLPDRFQAALQKYFRTDS